MGARGRKSTAELNVVRVASTARPEPWATLTDDEAGLWKSVVDSHPADHFRASDLPLLAAYCQAQSQYEKATDELSGEPLVIKVDGGRGYRNPLLDVQDTAARRMASLAGKLRLCPSSRYGPRKAATVAEKGGSATKPWQHGRE